MKVKQLYAELIREPDRWDMDLVVEVSEVSIEGITHLVVGELDGLSTTLEEPRRAILKVKVKRHERQEDTDADRG